jgi:outer membrane receptor protein involved in Fe transport
MARPFTGCTSRIARIRFHVCSFVLIALVAIARPALADTVKGRVLDPQDKPISAARILILRGQTVVATAESGADGRFAPVTLPPGKYDITVSGPGLNAAPRTITVTKDSTEDLEFKLTLAARSESVVVSAAQVDSALSRASDSVTVISRADLDAHQVATAADSLRLVPGVGVVQSGAPGHVTSLFPRGGESD